MATKEYKVSSVDNFRRYEDKRNEFFKYSVEEAKKSNGFLKQSKLPSQLPKKKPLEFKE